MDKGIRGVGWWPNLKSTWTTMSGKREWEGEQDIRIQITNSGETLTTERQFFLDAITFGSAFMYVVLWRAKPIVWLHTTRPD